MENREARSGAGDKARGRIKETVGEAKKKAGGALGDRELEAEGSTERGEGKIDRAKGAVKDKLEDAKDTARGGMQKAADKVVGRDRGNRH
jgi:uncharacterized protein YjbJ (UPF0337 family)